ncbi:MAG: hypothetical protein IRZ26_01520 [Clostridia bacterium]|nr:hypothetical protein [Clostridia bacterium]
MILDLGDGRSLPAGEVVLILDAACAEASPDFRTSLEEHRRRGRWHGTGRGSVKSYVLTAGDVLYASILSTAALRARLERFAGRGGHGEASDWRRRA